MNHRITGIIPARYHATRLPGKPLLDVLGKPMVLRVYEQAKKAEKLDEVIVATDDQRIFNLIESHGGKAQMTSSGHNNGTERCAEVAVALDTDYIINIQGDEPFINPKQIDELATVCQNNVELVTLIKKVNSIEDLQNDGIVKVLKNKQKEAMYFSRFAVPFLRDNPLDFKRFKKFDYWRHIGLYAYRKDILLKLVQLPMCEMEKMEKLEQLRWLYHGYKIKLIETTYESYSIDTPVDLKHVAKLVENGEI